MTRRFIPGHEVSWGQEIIQDQEVIVHEIIHAHEERGQEVIHSWLEGLSQSEGHSVLMVHLLLVCYTKCYVHLIVEPSPGNGVKFYSHRQRKKPHTILKINVLYIT
jgi:hypothetical protein